MVTLAGFLRQFEVSLGDGQRTLQVVGDGASELVKSLVLALQFALTFQPLGDFVCDPDDLCNLPINLDRCQHRLKLARFSRHIETLFVTDRPAPVNTPFVVSDDLATSLLAESLYWGLPLDVLS